MSAYTLTAICVSFVLVGGLRMGTWGLLRLALLVHLIGDVIFAPIWMIIPTYSWMRYVAEGDRQRAALFLALVVLLTDVAYRATGWLFALVRSTRATSDAPAEFGSEPAPAVDPGTRTPPSSLSASFLVVGILLKLVFLGATGVLTGSRSLGDLKPEDSVGLGSVVFLSDFLIPYGLVVFRRSRRSVGVGVDLLILAAVSYFSFSKAAFISYVVVYGLAYLLAFGHREARRQLFSWRLLLIVAVAFVGLGIKTQQRAGTAVDLSSSALADRALLGASARFMGGIFRAYSVTYREISAGWPPLGGGYHEQALVLLVPRVLWPEKPRVASEQLYYLLGVTEESYGTAFAVNSYGAMLFDFGVAGTILGALVFGVLLRTGDESVPRWRALRGPSRRGDSWHYLTTAWLFMAVPLSEAGLPIAIVNFAMLAIVFIPIQGASRIAYRVLALASNMPRSIGQRRAIARHQ